MRAMLNQTSAGASLHCRLTLAIVAIAWAACATATQASDPPTTTQPAAQPKSAQTAPEPDSKTGPKEKSAPVGHGKGGCNPVPKPPPVFRPTATTGDQAGKPATSQPAGAPQGPAWSSDKTTVTAGPVWAGKPLTCTFTVHNEGTADLEIRAKGG